VSLAPVGILGGTFDPIHFGHLRLATEALEQCRLSEIYFIPCGTPPHRSAPIASATQRLAMTRLALHGQAQFVLDEREIHRNDPCYTIDTLRSLRDDFGTQQSLCLLLGGDAFLQLHTWRNWQQVFELAHIIVVQRAGRPLGNAMQQADAALQQQYQTRLAPAPAALCDAAAGNIVVIDMPALDISATDIRRRMSEHRSIRYLLPDAVAAYLHVHQPYRPC
jgi:nicotinate-nucleotide adenylyltransferase